MFNCLSGSLSTTPVPNPQNLAFRALIVCKLFYQSKSKKVVYSLFVDWVKYNLFVIYCQCS